MGVFTKYLAHYIKFSKRNYQLFAGHQLVLLVCLSYSSNSLIDIFDSLNSFLETWKAQKGSSYLEPIFALDLAEHLKRVVSPPNWINQHVDHHLEN
jgi:hypothetical protein